MNHTSTESALSFRRRAQARVLAINVAALFATSALTPAFADGSNTTALGTPSPGYSVVTSSPQLSSVGSGGCSQQYTNQLNTLGDTVAGLGVTSAGAAVAELATEIAEFSGEGAEFITAGASLNAAGVAIALDVPLVGSADGAVVPIEAAGAALDAAGGQSIATAIGLGAETVGVAAGLTGAITQEVQQNLTDYVSGLPTCEMEFTGTISADANIAASQGISADGGAITLGDLNGTSYSSGITLGGGALSGAGFGGLEAFTGDVTAVAIGNNASAASAESIAFGTNALASNLGSVAVGGNATATGAYSIAAGYGSTASGPSSAAFGNSTTASGAFSVAAGYGSLASGTNSAAFGDHSTASGASSVAVGDGAQATRTGSIAVGLNAASTGTKAIAIGANAVATNSVAVGSSAVASNGGAAFGDNAVATGANYSTAVGPNAAALGDQSFAAGYDSRATGASSVAVGEGSYAKADYSAAFGPGASALAPNSTALGAGSIANEANTISVGTPYLYGQRRITNVARGREMWDAVNFSQFSAAILATAAAPVIQTPSAPGKTTFSVNTAYFRDQVGFGMGLAHRLNTARPAMVDLSVAEGASKEWIVRGGFSMEF